MKLFNVSLNIMSLGGLALGIGMLVDNAIVVTESIFRCREEGDDFLTSVIRGTSEVGPAVIASTLTTIAVFFPIVFVQGVAGQIFGDLALTVVFSLLASLAVALFVIPMLASRRVEIGQRQTQWNPARFFKQFEDVWQFKTAVHTAVETVRRASGARRGLYLVIFPIHFLYAVFRSTVQLVLALLGRIIVGITLVVGAVVGVGVNIWNRLVLPVIQWIVRGFNRGMERIYRAYPVVLHHALQRRGQVVGVSLLLFVLTLWVVLPRLGSELIPQVHQGEFNVDITLPVGTPVEATVQRIAPVEEFLLSLPTVTKVATVAGIDKTKINDSEAGEHTARLTVTLTPGGNLQQKEEVAIAEVRQFLSRQGGMAYNISRPVLFSFKTPIEVEIKGYDLRTLRQLSRQAVAVMSEIPGLYDVKTSLQSGNPEVQIIYDRQKLAHYGLKLVDVANIVRNKVRGDVATRFKEADRRIDVLVRVREEDRISLDRLRQLNVNPGGAIPIPLESVATIEVNEGPSEIRRIDQQRAALVMANVAGRDLSGASADVYAALQSLDFPPGFTFDIAGQNKEMEVSLNSLKLALLLAIFMVYIVMASQFESFLHPFVILFTIPFALIGVALTLWAVGIPLNIMVFLGLIMLAGIVVNNAIVLVDYINQLRRRGMDKTAAIVEAGKARLRPILMTTTTTVLGLLPMALGLGDGAEIRTPMAITVIAGLISATVLTLIVIPSLYAILERGK